MKKTDCSVVRDLLPLYIDDVCGAESKELVDEHLKQCRECTAEKIKMKGEIELPKDTGIKALMNIKITISKRVKRVIVILGSLLLTVIITVTAGILLSTYPVSVAYEDIDGRFVTLKQAGNSTIVSEMNENYELCSTWECVGEDADGMKLYVVYVGYLTTPIIELRKGIVNHLYPGYVNYQSDWIWSTGLDAVAENEEVFAFTKVSAIYYLPLQEGAGTPADKSEAVLIWSE